MRKSYKILTPLESLREHIGGIGADTQATNRISREQECSQGEYHDDPNRMPGVPLDPSREAIANLLIETSLSWGIGGTVLAY